ncbi:MAG TPA: LON peptidase substrate-binding domain-containing protein [Frankiaceae bacterium]|nr:LON peptidase substrate-binding domain-containing protein [Frankiaceae bacterium]
MTAELLPLFPLNTVLFPGVALPLHVFEQRYRILFDELTAQDGPKRFGVVAIRQGLEVGETEMPLLHEVGCVAELRHATRYDDGRYDVVATGGPRFRLVDVDDARPFLRAHVEYLPDQTGDAAGALAVATVATFADYWRAVAGVRGDDDPGAPPDIPVDDPALVSYVVAAAMRLDLPEKQALLAIGDTPARLRRVLSLLRRETALIGASPAEVPTEGPFSLN